MKRHIAARLAVAERAKHPTFPAFRFGEIEVHRVRELQPGSCFCDLRGLRWLLAPDVFSQLAIKVNAWDPPRLLDARYRHPRAIRGRT